MDPINVPKELKKITFSDHRPAFLFIDTETGKFPTTITVDGQKKCLYCGNILDKENKNCNCRSSIIVRKYNDNLSDK